MHDTKATKAQVLKYQQKGMEKLSGVEDTSLTWRSII